jgi:NAD(P)-dependent dehydrogenase (short-subunit alcohol dehydrogenase family)
MARALIVGGTSGIGEATAAAFLARGDEVTVAGRDPDRLAAALERLDGARGETADAGDRAAIAALASRLAPIDVLVFAASGGRGAGPLAELDLADLRDAFEQKLWPALTTLQAALPAMAPDAGIVLVTAGSARAAVPGTAGLAAVNGALEAMVQPLAAELAPLRVNAVSPGVVDTPWWSRQGDALRTSVFERFGSWLPAGRIGRPEEVAAAIVALATNGYVTGSILECGGGSHLAMGR